MEEEPWVFGTWDVLPEDRVEDVGFHAWYHSLKTLVPYHGSSGVFCRGPFGRKSMEPETVIHAESEAIGGISFDEDFLELLLKKLNG